MNRDVCEHFNPVDLPCGKCKPEALRLADALEISSNHGMRREAAAELRRLHAQRDALLEALKLAEKRLIAKCEKNLVAFNGEDVDTLNAIRAAIAKVEGEKE